MNHQPPVPRNNTNLVAVIVIAALLVVGAVTAVVVATSGEDSTPAAQLPPADARAAAARDAALADGRAAMETIHSFDYRTAAEDVDRWLSVATGDLLSALEANRDMQVERIEGARMTASSVVHEAALAEFDENAGTARMLAAVLVETTQDGQEPVEKLGRMTLTLERTDDGWKASDLTTG